MYEPVKKVVFLNYIKFLYNVLLYSGLIHFKYDAMKKRVKCSPCNHILSQILHRALKLFYGFLVWWAFSGALATYINFIEPQALTNRRVLMQDILLKLSLVYLRIFSTYVFSSNYLKRRDRLVRIINKALDIYNQLAPLTGYSIYFDSNVLFLVIVKMYFTALRMFQEYDELLPAAYVLKEVLLPYSYLVCATMNVSYICFQLVLICFYMKMNEILAQVALWSDNSEILKVLRKFVEISKHIYWVKKQLDEFYTILFIMSYIGFFHDIYYSYSVLQAFTRVEMKNFVWFYALFILLTYSPVCVLTTFDIYLLGRLSDMLANCEEIFKRRVMEVIDQRALQQHKGLQQRVELMLHHGLLQNIHTLAFGKICLNQKLSFDYFLNVIIINVLTCLQYYICMVEN